MEITQGVIDRLSVPSPTASGKSTQVFYRDSTLPGFAIRVSSGGTKAYVLERRIRGKVRRITLGRCDEMALARAQARVRKLNQEIARENAPRIINGTVVDGRIDLRTAYNLYIESHPHLKKQTVADYRRCLSGPLKDWLSVPVCELNTSMIIAKRADFSNEQARFNNAMRLLRAILNYVRLHLITVDHKAVIRDNPVDVLSRKNLWYPVRSSARQLNVSSDALKKWWQATQQLRKASTRSYLTFLLLSGLPRRFVSGLMFKDFDFANHQVTVSIDGVSVLTLPISRHLSQEIQQRSLKSSGPNAYAFPGSTKETPISDPRTAISRIHRSSGIKFNPRDLSRAFFSLAKQAGVDPGLLNLFTRIYSKRRTCLSAQEIEAMREVQERVFLTVFFLVGAVKQDTV